MAGSRSKKRAVPVARTAEQPEQALNIDVCFVPASHTVAEKLPAVSGSSGRLIVEPSPAEQAAPCWPGQVFSRTDLDYTDAMHQYIEATRERLQHPKTKHIQKGKKQARWRKECESRAERYQVRSQRKTEDIAWQSAKAIQRQARLTYQALSKAQRPLHRADWLAAQQTWSQVRAPRQQALLARQQEDEAWHQRVQQLKGTPSEPETVCQWLAILVITDNCTRQCLELPLFQSGPKLTSDELVTALRPWLPPALEFVISDQGTIFRTQTFAQLALDEGFAHVPIYRHRPESNGIAERFVRTLKEGLKSQSWQSAEALKPLLAGFRSEYNDRPHQGLAIPGLSPNEFAKRIWVT